MNTPLPKRAPEAAPRTERDIALQTNELAKWLMHWKWGQEPESGDYRFWDSANAKARGCWDAACHIQDLLRQTDAENALENMLQEQAAVFTHAPRAPICELGVYAKQRRYGSDYRAAHFGVAACRGGVAISLFRLKGEATAEVRLETHQGYLCGLFGPDALRELARCLIDAAADIESEGGAA